MTLTSPYPRKTMARVAEETWLRLRAMPHGTVIRVRIQTIDGGRRTLILRRAVPGYWTMLPPRNGSFKDEAVYFHDKKPWVIGTYYTGDEEF